MYEALLALSTISMFVKAVESPLAEVNLTLNVSILTSSVFDLTLKLANITLVESSLISDAAGPSSETSISEPWIVTVLPVPEPKLFVIPAL